jgi:hypothetical protein
MSELPFSASLVRDEAVLRFPYDEYLRQLLRAIPGRRWDPEDRVWCIPLEPDQAQALALLLASLPGEPLVSEALARAIKRRRGSCSSTPTPAAYAQSAVRCSRSTITPRSWSKGCVPAPRVCG